VTNQYRSFSTWYILFSKRYETPIPIQHMKEIGGITIAQLTGITQ